jgi:hypothetical protein
MKRRFESFAGARRACLVAQGILGLVLGGLLAAAPARAADPKLQIKFDDKNAKYADTESEILLRPNVEQKVFFAVHYPASEKKPRNATVELVVDGKTVASKPLVLKPGDTTPVSFGKPKPPPMPMAAPTAPMAPMKPEMKTLQGPPFPLKVRLVSKAAQMGAPDIEQSVTVSRIMVPAEYVTVASTYDFEEGKLTMNVQAQDNFSGPPCKVELVLPKDRLPVMANAGNQRGQLSATLEKAGDVKSLFVENLRFEAKDEVVEGIVYLTVDSYPRAFIIKHDFGKKSNKNTGNPSRDPSVRLKAAPEAVEGKPYTFHLEVDYRKQALTDMPSPDEVKLEIGLYRDEAMKEADYKSSLGPSVKSQKLLYTPDGPDDSLLINPAVTDWTMDKVGTQGVVGQRFLRVRLLGKNGKVVEWRGPKGKEPLMARQDIEFYKGKKPSPIVFLEPPKEAQLGQEVTFKVKVKPGFKIKEAFIFLGKPLMQMDKKVAPDDKKALEMSQDEPGVWQGKLAMPEDKTKKKETVSLLARGSFGDGAEEPVDENVSIALKEAPAVKPSGTLKVTLTYAGKTAPKSKVAIFLIQQGKEPQGQPEQTTDADGVVTFKNLDPGEYSLAAAGAVDGKIKGSMLKIMVEVNKTTEKKVVMKRQ